MVNLCVFSLCLTCPARIRSSEPTQIKTTYSSIESPSSNLSCSDSEDFGLVGEIGCPRGWQMWADRRPDPPSAPHQKLPEALQLCRFGFAYPAKALHNPKFCASKFDFKKINLWRFLWI